MKTLLIALALLSTTPAFAARDIVSIDCEGKSRSMGLVTLQAKSLYTYVNENEARIQNVIMNVQYDGKSSTGRSASIDNDKNYRPTKYKNHFRFDMTNLVDTKDFSKFYPNGCSINVMMPKDIVDGNASRVEVPVTETCDQSGGGMVLDCKVTTVR